MTVHTHAHPAPETIDSFTDLQLWLDYRLDCLEEDLADGETAQAMGRQLRERRATLLDVVHVIHDAVVIEKAERAIVSAEEAGEASATGIRLKCASSADSNEFWQAAGFYCTRVTPGGIKRGRDLNHYRTDLQPGMFLPSPVTPSEKPIDLGPYNAMKRLGVSMPSRFSRTHYGIPADASEEAS